MATTRASSWQQDIASTRSMRDGYATPATYTVNGKQFVIIAAGGGKMGARSGMPTWHFTLPA
jgi:glucose dehydrogenase